MCIWAFYVGGDSVIWVFFLRRPERHNDHAPLISFSPPRKATTGKPHEFIMVTVTGMESMSTVPLYRKRELSPLRRACLSLGLPVDAKPKTNLSWQLRKAKLGNTAIEYLGLSVDDQAQRIVAVYLSLNATERKAVTIDYLVMAVGADVHHVSGVIQEEVSRMRGMKVGILVHTDVLNMAIQRALKPDGYQDRKLLFDHYLRARTF